jgi:hypothetical protein
MIAYHCHARWMNQEFDGIVTVKSWIDDMDKYSDLKVNIAKFLTELIEKKTGPIPPNHIKPEQIVITSLTLME